VTASTLARLGLGLAVGTLLLSCTARGPLHMGAWVTYWDFGSGMALVERHPDALRDVLFFIAHLDADGRPVLANPDLPVESAVARVKAAGARPWLTIVNDVASGHGIALKDPQAVHDLLDGEDRRAAHRAAIMDLASRYGMAGVDIDYENLRARDRNVFTTFVRELAADARRQGVLLSVTVQPKLGERWSDGAGAADWGALCASVDRLQIMLYNLHSRATGPGPMATGRWIRGVLSYANSQCDPARVVPVLKVSGMRWADGAVDGVQYDQAMALVRQHNALIARDTDDQVPHFTYAVNGRPHTVYYEDAVSLREKLAVIRSLGYRSVVLWSLGRQDPALFPLSASGEAGDR
jgi:spore germination protein YaaH